MCKSLPLGAFVSVKCYQMFTVKTCEVVHDMSFLGFKREKIKIDLW